MSYKLHYVVDTQLPRLGWLAALDREQHSIQIHCGRDVERRDKWMVEGVWDGNFAAGEFFQSEHFFGSGLHVHGEVVRFVPSSTMMDRLLWCQLNGQFLISNSLVLLLAKTGARLDPQCDYRRESVGSALGIDDYPKTFRVKHPELTHFGQVFYDTLVYHRGQTSTERRSKLISIASYGDYIAMLRHVLRGLKANYSSPARSVGVSAYSTVSAGYDSPAVACLVRDIDVGTCYTSRLSNSVIPRWCNRNIAIDDGTPIAQVLGLETRYLDPVNAHADPEDELYFLSSTRQSPELIFHSMVRDFRQSDTVQVLFTGHHGDAIWNINPPPENRRDVLYRADSNGLALCEVRLHAGFFQVSVPTMFARNSLQIIAISGSPDMQPWSIGTRYDRPIARRILEEAGVPRNYFGLAKKAIAQEHDYPQTPALRRQFCAAMGYPELFLPTYTAANWLGFLAGRAWVYARCGGNRMLARRTLTPRTRFWRDTDLRRRSFIWATDIVSSRLARHVQAQPAASGHSTLAAAPAPALLRAS